MQSIAGRRLLSLNQQQLVVIVYLNPQGLTGLGSGLYSSHVDRPSGAGALNDGPVKCTPAIQYGWTTDDAILADHSCFNVFALSHRYDKGDDAGCWEENAINSVALFE
jgi:hypothetical protein